MKKIIFIILIILTSSAYYFLYDYRGLLFKSVNTREIEEAKKEGDAILQELEKYRELNGKFPESIDVVTVPTKNIKLGKWGLMIEGDNICVSVGSYIKDGIILERCGSKNNWFVDG